MADSDTADSTPAFVAELREEIGETPTEMLATAADLALLGAAMLALYYLGWVDGLTYASEFTLLKVPRPPQWSLIALAVCLTVAAANAGWQTYLQLAD
jgi:hypothetical protein